MHDETSKPDTLREIRFRRVFRGKGGIHGTDYVAFGQIGLEEAIRRVAEHLQIADEIHIETRDVSEWRPLESSGD